MARGKLSPEERALMQAQTQQVVGETAAQQQKLALAAQELGLRQQATSGEVAASRAETTRKAELSPYEKLLSLGKLAEPDTQERMNRLRSAVDILATQERARTAASTIQANKDERQMIIDAQVADRAAASKSNIQDALVSHLVQRGDVPLSTIAETLRAGGQGDFATGLEAAGQVEKEKRFQSLKTQLPMMQKQGKLDEFLAQPQIDDTMRERLKPFITETQKTVEPPTPLGQHLGTVGKFTAMGLVNPALPIAELERRMVAPVAKAAMQSNFWKSYYKGLVQ